MDYGDFRTTTDYEERKKKIDDIYSLFDIDSGDMSQACKAAGVDYPDSLYTYFFFARCINAGRGLEKEAEEEGADLSDLISERADDMVPHQTYILWMIWVDCGYEDDYLEDMGYQPEIGELYKIPQIQLYGYAERILYSFADE
tara:strand:+ start:96 stop:524 length:429 start_codon:yes stop_codon:yes gene_type:complete